MNSLLYFIFACIISVTISLFLIFFTSDSGNLDWDQHLAFGEVIRKSILEFNQFPFWNPYHCGGTELIGFPENEIFSLNSVCILMFGAMDGYKVAIGIKLLIGFYGFFILGRYFKLTVEATFAMAISYLFSGHFLLPYAAGMTNFLALSYLPYIFLFFTRAFRESSFKFALLTAIFVTLQFFAGFHYVGMTLLFLAMYALFSLGLVKLQTAAKYTLLVLVLFLLLSGPKLFPSIRTVFLHSTIPGQNFLSGYSLQSFWHSLLSRAQTFQKFDQLTEEMTISQGRSYLLDENGMYVGILCVVFFLIGIYRKGRKYRSLVFILLLFLAASFGDNLYPSVHQIIQKVPLMQYIRVAQRYHWFYMFIFSFFVGYGFLVMQKFLRKSRISQLMRKVIVGGILFIILADLLVVNTKVLLHDVFFPMPNLSRAPTTFKQTCSKERYAKLGWINASTREEYYYGSYSSEYVNVVLNLGVNEGCYELVNYTTSPSCITESDYIGEHYLKNSKRRIYPKYWSVNKIEFDFSSRSKDILVINQNFSPYWFVYDGKYFYRAITNNGLISTPIKQGRNTVSFFYFPILFYLGLISMFSTVLFIMRRQLVDLLHFFVERMQLIIQPK